jgi:signal transduction histidine kinase
MNLAVSVMQTNSPPDQSMPLILDSIPTPEVLDRGCPARTRQQIDLILLAIEALELGGSETMLKAAQELELQDIVKNRVVLWRMRCTNPLRRSYTRRALEIDEAKALVVIASHMSRRMTVLIRQLLLAAQQLQEKQLPVEQHFRLSEYLERFRAHFRSRMNPRRAKVAVYSSNDKLNELALSLLAHLLFCTGTSGMQRFWISLFDGEVL